MALGPRNRDYSVTLNGPWYGYTRQPDGTWRMTNSGRFASRSGILTVKNPYREKRPPGLSPTPRTLNHIRQVGARGVREWAGMYRESGELSGDGHLGFLANAWDTSNYWTQLRTEAILEALAALKDQKWNAGVMLAESQGIAKMVTDTSRLVIAVREALRKGNYREAYERFRSKSTYMAYPQWRSHYWDEISHIASVRSARQIPSGWLYYHYGIKPTINDIDGAVTELLLKNRLGNPSLWENTVRGYAKHTVKETRIRDENRNYGEAKLARLRSIRVTLTVSPKPGFAGRLSQLGITNPPEAIWNRIPFSFLVDYLTTCGDWLSALDVGMGWRFGTWVEATRDLRQATFRPMPGRDVTHFSGSPATYNRKDINRTVRNDLYGPIGSVLPTLKLRNPSATQVANVLSLLATGFGAPVRP